MSEPHRAEHHAVIRSCREQFKGKKGKTFPFRVTVEVRKVEDVSLCKGPLRHIM